MKRLFNSNRKVESTYAVYGIDGSATIISKEDLTSIKREVSAIFSHQTREETVMEVGLHCGLSGKLLRQFVQENK